MLVYILNKNGCPLMPCKASKARRLLKDGLAKVVKRTPFTIQMLHGSSGYKQEIVLGVDAGSKVIGLSATTNKSELYSAEVVLRKDITNLISTRSQYRRTRRGRKTRYRQPRFLNRVKSKHKGWLAPSIENKIRTHLSIINKIHQILPISKIIVETASFNIQKIKKLEISGEEYQTGPQLGFWNTREYVLHRDGHKCQGKSGCTGKILNVHHIESRKTGGDSPGNLITLCKECHSKFHAGNLKLNLKRSQSFRDAAFMGIMRKTFYNRLKESYSDVELTYGYITKSTRILNGLPKEHRVDALCITGNPGVKRSDNWYYIKQTRKHNRQIHKANILKGGMRKLNQSPYTVKGFRLFDKVKFNGQECFIFGRRVNGYFKIITLDGNVLSIGTSYKNLKLLELRKTLLWESKLNNIKNNLKNKIK